MKSYLRAFALAASLTVASSTFAADRWSTDETAVRMGVNTWFSLWARPAVTAGSQEVKNLYATEPSTQLPAVILTSVQPGVSRPSATGQPERFAVRLEGNRAVTSFQLRADSGAPGAGSQVVLTWERRGGLWRIVQESFTPAPESSERVALSESTRK